MNKRWVTIKVSEQEALHHSQTCNRTAYLLSLVLPMLTRYNRVVAEQLCADLQEQMELWDRGLDEAEVPLPTDQWGRPLLPPEAPLKEWLARGTGQPIGGTSLEIDL